MALIQSDLKAKRRQAFDTTEGGAGQGHVVGSVLGGFVGGVLGGPGGAIAGAGAGGQLGQFIGGKVDPATKTAIPSKQRVESLILDHEKKLDANTSKDPRVYEEAIVELTKQPVEVRKALTPALAEGFKNSVKQSTVAPPPPVQPPIQESRRAAFSSRISPKISPKFGGR